MMNTPTDKLSECYKIVDKYGLQRSLCNLDPTIYTNEYQKLSGIIDSLKEIGSIYDEDMNSLNSILKMVDNL